MIYTVSYKKFSVTQQNVVLVDDDIEADGYTVNECGVLTFYNHDGYNTLSIPPGLWILVQPAPADKPQIVT